MIAKSIKREKVCTDNAGSQKGKGESPNPFLMRFLKPPQVGMGNPGETIFTFVERETTDDR